MAAVCEAFVVLGQCFKSSHNNGLGCNSQKEPALGRNSLDAELGGCAVFTNNLSRWIDKSMRERLVL